MQPDPAALLLLFYTHSWIEVMDFFSLVDDVMIAILRPLRNRDRFGRFALVSRECHRLAFDLPLHSLNLFGSPLTIDKYTKVDSKYHEFLARNEIADLDAKAVVEFERLLDDFIASSYFLSRLNLGSIRVLELYGFDININCISAMSKYFTGLHYMKISRLRVGDNLAIISPIDRKRLSIHSFDAFHKFPKLIGFSIDMMDKILLDLNAENFKYLEIGEFDPFSFGDVAPLLAKIATAVHLEELVVPQDVKIANLLKLKRLEIKNHSFPELFEGYKGSLLKKLTLSVKNYRDFPDLNSLAHSLDELVLTESTSRPFTIPKTKVSELKLTKLALLATDTALSLSSFSNPELLKELTVNTRAMDDHFVDVFFNSLKRFVNVTSLSIAGPIFTTGLKKSIAFFPKLVRFAYDDNSDIRFPLLQAASAVSLLEAFPGNMEEIKFNTTNDVFDDSFVTALERFKSLRTLRLLCRANGHVSESWLCHLTKCSQLEELEISRQNILFPSSTVNLLETDLIKILQKLPRLRKVHLGFLDPSWSPADIKRHLPDLEIFEVYPNNEPFVHPDFVQVMEEEEFEEELDDEPLDGLDEFDENDHVD